MIGDKDLPALPMVVPPNPTYGINYPTIYMGLTKREYIAIEVLKGFCSGPWPQDVEDIARRAWQQADAFIRMG